MLHRSPHTFHIPVMGLAFTIDTPIKVARFGISSVISIVEDNLIELMRKHYYPVINQTYYPIDPLEDDYRAKRITDYLNLVNIIVKGQIEKLKQSSFGAEGEIDQYFEMLPDNSPLKKTYLQMLATDNMAEKERLSSYLKTTIKLGSIDVNVMTKIDGNQCSIQGEAIENGSEAVAALRGYINSNLKNSSIIFSAGLNPRLYNYLEKCSAFTANEDGSFNKKVTIKVSDYRSALIQGKYLAKKGIWVSEFRIESGLNCGGHAFATDGFLLGPILEEFKLKRNELVETLFELYAAALKSKNESAIQQPPPLSITVQGGIGTAEENIFLHRYYGIQSTGWGTPFLLVPEATTVDNATLKLLAKATTEDVVLSNNSPLGIRFYYLKGTTGETERIERIIHNKPGSPCTEKHLAFNTEFTKEPICIASRKYQHLKIAQLQTLSLPEKEYQKKLAAVLEKECLCVGLSNAAAINYTLPLVKKLSAVTICPGPNIAYFTKIVSLKKMVSHIYGRTNIIEGAIRPNMFIIELNLYINYLKEQLANENGKEIDVKRQKYFDTFLHNLQAGIAYYKTLNFLKEMNNTFFAVLLSCAESILDEVNIMPLS